MKKACLFVSFGIVAFSVLCFVYRSHPIRFTPDSRLDYFLKKRGITADEYKPYLNVKDTYGCGLRDILAQGIKDWNVDTRLGVRVCSPEAYNGVYGNVVDKLIVWYHKIDPNFVHKSDLDATKISNLVLDPEKKYIVSSRARVARNIEGLPFRKAQDLASTLKTESIISGALEKLGGKFKGEYFRLPNLKDEEKQQLISEHLLFADMKNSESMLVSGIYKSFTPEGSGIFINQDKTLVAWVNEEDHLRIISIMPDADIKGVFLNLTQAVALLDKLIPFVKNDKYGYLGSCPSNIGTTLRASFLIKLPFLAKNMPLLKQIASRNGLDVRSSSGEEGTTKDDTFDISNEARIGYTEVELINKLILGTAEILQEERKAEAAK